MEQRRCCEKGEKIMSTLVLVCGMKINEISLRMRDSYKNSVPRRRWKSDHEDESWEESTMVIFNAKLNTDLLHFVWKLQYRNGGVVALLI